MLNDLVKCPICKTADFLQQGTGWQNHILPGLMRCANNKVDFGNGKYYHFAFMPFQYEAYIFGDLQIYFYDDSITIGNLAEDDGRKKIAITDSSIRYEDINSKEKLKQLYENYQLIS